jgi:hypothetical protein
MMTTTTTNPCNQRQHRHQGVLHQRDRIPTMVFSPVLTSSSSQPLKPCFLARDLSYGDQEELARKLNDLYWYAHAVPTANLLQKQQQPTSQTDQQWLRQASSSSSSSYNKKNTICKAQGGATRARAQSAELGRQMKIGVIPSLQEDVEESNNNKKPPLSSSALKKKSKQLPSALQNKSCSSSILSRRPRMWSQLFWLPSSSSRKLKSTNSSTKTKTTTMSLNTNSSTTTTRPPSAKSKGQSRVRFVE